MNNIGGVYSDLGEKQKALEWYEKALPLFGQVGDRGGEATTMNNIGAVYNALGEKKKALEWFEKALALRVQVGAGWEIPGSLDNISAVLDDLDRGAEAIARSREAAALFLKRSTPPRQADREEAVGSLAVALRVAIRHRLPEPGQALLGELRALGAPDALLGLREAQLLSRGGQVAQARAAYQQLRQIVAQAPADQQLQGLALLAAAEVRLARGGSFDGCLGLLVTQVVPGSTAARLGLRVGDVVVRYRERCLCWPEDPVRATAQADPGGQAPLVYFREGQLHPVSVPAGRLGLGITDF